MAKQEVWVALSRPLAGLTGTGLAGTSHPPSAPTVHLMKTFENFSILARLCACLASTWSDHDVSQRCDYVSRPGLLDDSHMRWLGEYFKLHVSIRASHCGKSCLSNCVGMVLHGKVDHVPCCNHMCWVLLEVDGPSHLHTWPSGLRTFLTFTPADFYINSAAKSACQSTHDPYSINALVGIG